MNVEHITDAYDNDDDDDDDDREAILISAINLVLTYTLCSEQVWVGRSIVVIFVCIFVLNQTRRCASFLQLLLQKLMSSIT